MMKVYNSKNPPVLQKPAILLWVLMMFSLPVTAAIKPSLVSVGVVESWNEGEVNIVNCQVSVPFLTAFSSENSATLTYLIPKGSDVKKGELIAQQQNFYYANELTRLKQQLEISDTELKYSISEYNRLTGLKNNMIAKTQLANLLLKRHQSSAKQKQLTNEIAELEYRIDRLAFRAPANGVIVETFSEPGEYLTQGTKILSFLAEDEKEISCQIPVSKFARNKHTNYSLMETNSKPLVLSRVSQLIENKGQFISAYLKSKASLLPYFIGQRVRVRMNTVNEQLIRLPLDSLNLSNAGDYVWKVDSGNKVRKVAVKLIANQSDSFLVQSLLKAGERVVTIGRSGLVSDQQVLVSGPVRGIK